MKFKNARCKLIHYHSDESYREGYMNERVKIAFRKLYTFYGCRLTYLYFGSKAFSENAIYHACGYELSF